MYMAGPFRPLLGFHLFTNCGSVFALLSEGQGANRPVLTEQSHGVQGGDSCRPAPRPRGHGAPARGPKGCTLQLPQPIRGQQDRGSGTRESRGKDTPLGVSTRCDWESCGTAACRQSTEPPGSGRGRHLRLQGEGHAGSPVQYLHATPHGHPECPQGGARQSRGCGHSGCEPRTTAPRLQEAGGAQGVGGRQICPRNKCQRLPRDWAFPLETPLFALCPPWEVFRAIGHGGLMNPLVPAGCLEEQVGCSGESAFKTQGHWTTFWFVSGDGWTFRIILAVGCLRRLFIVCRLRSEVGVSSLSWVLGPGTLSLCRSPTQRTSSCGSVPWASHREPSLASAPAQPPGAAPMPHQGSPRAGTAQRRGGRREKQG